MYIQMLKGQKKRLYLENTKEKILSLPTFQTSVSYIFSKKTYCFSKCCFEGKRIKNAFAGQAGLVAERS